MQPGAVTKAYRTVAGAGATIICLHSSTSSSKQWQALVERVSGGYRVVGVDLYGYGRTSPWAGERRLTLDDEVELFADVIAAEEEPVHLVGHSYGGAVAARASVRYPAKVASLTMYEPVLFGLLQGDRNSEAAAAEILAVYRYVRERVAAGEAGSAAEHFVDYWSGAGTWAGLPDWRQGAVAAKMSKVVADFEAVLAESDLAPYYQLTCPTLLIGGLRSPLASRRVVQLLLSAIPEAEFTGLVELGHMGPVTHADEVNGLVEEFVGRVEGRRRTRVA